MSNILSNTEEWDDEFEHEFKTCDVCGEELHWEECTDCEDGYYDCYEDDPLWYEPWDVKPCNTCDGKSGWYVCWNYKNHKEN